MTPASWKTRAGLILAGAGAALALPPLPLFPLLWLSFPWLLRELARRNGAKAAFAAGWWWGVGYFALGLYWIAHAFLVDAARFGWMIPFAIPGLAGVCAIYIGATTAIVSRAPAGWPRLLLLSAAWGASEWLRGELFTGFPWNPLSSVWHASVVMLQPLALFGAFGLSALTLLAAGTPSLFFAGRAAGLRACAAGLLLVTIWAGYGLWRLPAGAMPEQPGIRLRLVQANIAQSLKWQPDRARQNFLHQLAMSATPAGPAPTHIIWPETAAPSFLDYDRSALQRLTEVVPAGGLLLVGSVRGIVENGEVRQVWNSLRAIDGSGALLGDYDKAHLVPFGEYVPLPHWIPIAKLTAGSVGFSAGSGPATLALPGLPPVGPQICYEDVFPAKVVSRDRRPDWILVITNDGWFGISSGPHQHFAAARMRAVEEGLPLVRAANTGISGVIDPYGRVTARLGLDTEGVLDAALPQPLRETPFSRFGSFILLFLLTSLAGLGVLAAPVARRMRASD